MSATKEEKAWLIVLGAMVVFLIGVAVFIGYSFDDGKPTPTPKDWRR